MNLSQRISAFAKLGDQINQTQPFELQQIIENVKNQNPWFTEGNIKLAIEGITKFLTLSELEKWTSSYDLDQQKPKTIGIAMAGNIPLVGFHDFLCVLLAGHR